MTTRTAILTNTVRWLAVVSIVLTIPACGPNFYRLRREGQNAMAQGQYVLAKQKLEAARDMEPEDPEVLFDLGMVCRIQAERALADGNQAAAYREIDRAIECFDRAIEARPSMQAAIEARTDALAFKGQSDEALKSSEWAMRFVGPSAKSHIFVARQLEGRGDMDGAMLRYRQAVEMEPKNATAHAAFGRFLLRIGRREEGIAQLERAYRLNPLEEGVARDLAEQGVPLPRTTGTRKP